MLTLDLVKLEQEGSLPIQATIPEDAILWDGTGIRFAKPLDVDLRASTAISGEYLVRGTLESAVRQSCTRCLKDVQVPLNQEVAFLFGPQDEMGEEGDGEVRTIDPAADHVDLEPPIREELILTAPAYVVCSTDCKGLCPTCGVDLNNETCQCVHDDADPRWEALRTLKTD